MDIKTAVFNAARDGKVKLIQKLLCNKTPRELEALAEEKTQGGTPLLIASRYGHLEVVDYLLQHCKVNAELGGSVNFDGETIEGAPPLWAASAAGHLPVVRSLLKHGASVNSTTLTNSTPLRAACFDGHLEIVRYLVEHRADMEVANRHGHTCLMISCYKGHKEIARFLLERGADVNRRSVKGNTALHDCAESGSLDIMKMLLKCGARVERDGYGMTPLLAASVTGHTNVVEYLVHQPRTSRPDRVDALELLGATFVDKKRDLLGAMRCWRRAMELRQPGGRAGALAKPAAAGPPVPAYDHAREAATPEELEALIADPDEMRMQALLVRERVLGPAHPDTSYYIRYRGAVYADSGNFERCVALWRYALDMQQGNLEPLSPMTASSLLSFAELFSFVLQDRAKGAVATRVTFRDLMAVLGRSVREVERAVAQRDGHPDAPQFTKVLSIILHLLFLLERLGGGPEEEHQKRQAVYRLLKLHPRARNGHTPLHMAVDRDTTAVGRYPVGRFPSAAVAALLLECGADPDARDSDNNTPLHVCAASGSPDIMAALVRAGAHFDATNGAGRTACELLEERHGGRHAIPPLAHVTLQCLAARAIERHRLPYKGLVPREMEAFIELH
ncbi:protein fem-1 homolog A-like [Anguilla anguilla]|uniref:protein fem-1 homolog A-like n=1 Tax=Anguilla anguilla TaxID=7936 RepID=UPI0015A87153|nr:protein fem-1 homolog A-like [Anguilla anguilla]XP_035268114.1 protein fem-1 homolog A-like [Anguilla anguilla]XP_035268115.1 protein fem-1 homolog A-like [Anguilla anguilla]